MGVYGYAKHSLFLSRLLEIPGLSMEEYSIKIDRKGFYISLGEASYGGIFLDKARMRAPLFKLSGFTLKGEGFRLGDLTSHSAKIIFSDNHASTVEYFSLKRNRLKIWGDELHNHEISGKGNFSKDISNFSLHATMIYRHDARLFALTCFGDIEKPLSEEQKGKIKLKVTDFKNLLALAMKGSSLSSWQAGLAIKAFSDNAIIPLDVKGEKVYLGPLKLFTLRRQG